MHEQLRTFTSFILIQDQESEMYQSGMKLVELLKQVPKFQDMVNEDREDDFGEMAPLEEDDNMVSNIAVPDSSN